MLIFHYNALPVNNTFAAGLTSRKVEVPASDLPFVASMTFDADGEVSDADRQEWYSNGESRLLEIEAGAFEAAVGLESGRFFG